MDAARRWRSLGHGQYYDASSNGPYDHKEQMSEDRYVYFADFPKKIAENVASFQASTQYWAVLKTDGSLWTVEATDANSGFVKKLGHVAKMSVSSHILAVQENGTLWAWGRDWHGQLGLGDKIPNPAGKSSFERYYANDPIKIMKGVSKVDTNLHSLILKQDGRVWSK